MLPSESSDEQHPPASWTTGAAAVLPSESSDEQHPRASWKPGAAAVLPSESSDEQPCHQLCESSDDEQPCKNARSSGSRTARPRRQPQLARYVPEQSGASTRLPSESSESGNDAVDAHARKANMRQGLVSTTAHGPCTLEEVQDIFLWPRDAFRAATATLKNPHDPGSFLNRPVVMATQFSGLGSAELAANMLRSWSEVFRGRPLHLSIAYACEKSPSLQAVLKTRSPGMCVFKDITDRIVDMPPGLCAAKVVDFDTVMAMMMQSRVTDMAPCATHGHCPVPRANVFVAGPSCKPWSRARHRGEQPVLSHKDTVLFLAWCRVVLADLPDLIVFENVVGFDVGLLHDIFGALYCVQAVEMRPEDLGFSFILRPRVYAILARKTSVDLDADAFSLFRQLQAGACRQRTAPPAVMAASDEELLQEENSARMARGMLALDRPSGNWRYLLPKSQVKRLADHEKKLATMTEVTASVVDLSQSLRFGRWCQCVPTMRRSTVKPLWIRRHNRWLIQSELAAMMGFPVCQLWSQVAGVPVDMATMAGPPAALGNAMHVACVGTALACALTAARCSG